MKQHLSTKKRKVSSSTKKNTTNYINLNKIEKKRLKSHISYLINKNKKYTKKNKYLFPK
jgi:hypothetical protein